MTRPAPDNPARLVVMLSGSGRTASNLLDRIDAGQLRALVPLVIASRECKGAELMRARGVDVRVVPGVVPADRLEEVLDDARTDLLVLAGYLRLVSIPRSYTWRVVNIHPALLPSFGGPGMHGMRVHRAVLETGCKVSGCTVHLCDSAYDRGAIVAQASCPVLEHDTPETLAERVFALELDLYPRALQLLIDGRVEVIEPDPGLTNAWARTRITPDTGADRVS